MRSEGLTSSVRFGMGDGSAKDASNGRERKACSIPEVLPMFG